MRPNWQKHGIVGLGLVAAFVGSACTDDASEAGDELGGTGSGTVGEDVSDDASSSSTTTANDDSTSDDSTSSDSTNSDSTGSDSTGSDSTGSDSTGSDSSSSDSSSSDSSSSDSSSSDSNTGAPDECPSDELLGPLPITVMGDNSNAADDFQACGELGGLDVSYSFIAPEQGSYVIDTFGSDFDTVLSVVDGLCQVTDPLTCNDDTNGPTSQVQIDLEAGQQVTINVDGFIADSIGGFTLNIDLGSSGVCPPPSDIGGQSPHQELGILDAGPGEIVGECAGGGNELTFAWTAPADGLYTFDTIGSTFDTVLYVRDGVCEGAELACNDDTFEVASQVQVMLAAGQVVVIVLDSFAPDQGGSYTLNIAG